MNSILVFLGSERYNQHAICLTNDPLMMFMYIWGDGATSISYFVIGIVMLLRFKMNQESPSVTRRSLLPLYGSFIFLCGLSHLTQIFTLFWGIYRLDVFVTAAMASVSGATAYFTLKDFLERDKSVGA